MLQLLGVFIAYLLLSGRWPEYAKIVKAAK
jgi:hypothetical protein